MAQDVVQVKLLQDNIRGKNDSIDCPPRKKMKLRSRKDQDELVTVQEDSLIQNDLNMDLKKKWGKEQRDRNIKLRRFVCDVCDYAAASNVNLKAHKIIHTGKRPSQCDQCDFKYSNSSNLSKHKLVHTGVKKFACELCSYRTAENQVLKRHVQLVHTAEKLFQCDLLIQPIFALNVKQSSIKLIPSLIHWI